MKLQIIKESLKPSTAYMLRNDSKLFELKDIHPYILSPYFKFTNNECIPNDVISDIFDTTINPVNPILWFYKHTNHADIKSDISKFLYIIYNNIDYFGDYKNQIDSLQLPLIETYGSKKECCSLLAKINAECNQEFCRVQTSNMLWGGNNNDIYFRISSIGFNWFNIIWELVYNNKNFISNVTIVKDTGKDEGTKYVYKHNCNTFYRMPTDEFLSVGGKPIVEHSHNKNLLKGKSLTESLGEMNIINFMRTYTILNKIELNNYMEVSKLERKDNV